MIVRRSADRFASEYQGIRSLHLYSAGAHYDPSRMGFGSLIGFDEHLLAPGAGFEKHRHRDVDIVTWVLAGVLEHLDDAGRSALVRPGDVQVQHCGTGIEHVERNASNVEPLRFLQVAFRPSAVPDAPRYELFEAVRGSAVPLPEASLRVVSLRPGERQTLAGERLQLLHVVQGRAGIQRPVDTGVHRSENAGNAGTGGTGETSLGLLAGDSVEISISTGREVTLEAVDSSVEALLVELK